jgi:hypothetical protein
MSGQSQRNEWACSVCGSTRLKLLEGESPTGVTSEDGYIERRWWEAIECLSCGAVEEL